MPELKYSQDLEFHTVIRRRIICSDAHFFHPETYSLEFIRSGRVFLFSETGCCDLTAPMLFWMAPGEAFRFERIPEATQVCEHVYTNFFGPRAERISAALHEGCPQGCLRPDNPEKVDGIFQEMVREYRVDATRFHSALVLQVEMLMQILADSLNRPNRPKTDPFGISKTQETIKTDPFADIDFESAAERAGISYSYFRRLFAKQVGTPIYEYVRSQRMCRAAEMLRNTRMRIKEIVYNCGFDNLAEFSREFKRWSGVPPREYRDGK